MLNSRLISACKSTIPIDCELVAKQGEKLMTIDSKITDSNNETIIEWDAQEKGLSIGTWDIYFRLKGDDSHKSTSEILDIE